LILSGPCLAGPHAGIVAASDDGKHIMQNRFRAGLAGAGLFLSLTNVAATAAELPPEMMPNVMPYAEGLPQHPVATPGATISADNLDQVQDVMVPMLFDMVKRGWLPQIKVTETTPVPAHPAFLEATAGNTRGAITFDADKVNAVGYVSGRPFPFEPDPNDPLAGLKLLWNYRYSMFEGDSEYIHQNWKYRDMRNEQIERELRIDVHIIRHMNRVINPPIPAFEDNPGGIYNSFYLLVKEPFDVANTQLLVHTYADDNKRTDAWLYLGFQRRVRRLATGQVTDAFLGSDLMIEDFRGYNTRISEYEWKYVETRTILAPVYHYADALSYQQDMDSYQGVKKEGSTGRAGCFPDVPYQLRKVYVVDGTPRDPSHPLSRRLNYLDVESSAFLYSQVYDRKGEPWKLFTIPYHHPDTSPYEVNHGSGSLLWSQPSQIDVQNEHCTTLHFNTVNNDTSLEERSRFTPQYLRKAGR
jgi:hypothetical protein